MIIGFAGRARHGKDYTAAWASHLLKNADMDVVTHGFANELKDRVGLMFADIPSYPSLRDEKPPWLRKIYQAVGEGVRQYDPNFWTDRLIIQYTTELAMRPEIIWLVPDVRYDNEIDAIKQVGGKVIKIVRENEDGSHYRCPRTDGSHPSEAQIDLVPDRKFDAIIHAKNGMTGWLRSAVMLNLEGWGLL